MTGTRVPFIRTPTTSKNIVSVAGGSSITDWGLMGLTFVTSGNPYLNSPIW